MKYETILKVKKANSHDNWVIQWKSAYQSETLWKSIIEKYKIWGEQALKNDKIYKYIILVNLLDDDGNFVRTII